MSPRFSNLIAAAFLLSSALLFTIAGAMLFARYNVHATAVKEAVIPATEASTTSEPTHQELPVQAMASSTEPGNSLPMATGTSVIPPDAKHRTQYVLLAFDGSYSIPMWKETRAFAEQMNTNQKPVHFTYFVSGVYLLTGAASKTYTAPHQPPGTSAIKFATTKADVANRIEQMNLAMQEGHEIGSHANGHFTGAAWTADDWRSELTQFNTIVHNASTIDGLDREPSIRKTLQLPPQGIVGFRAPELGTSPALWPVLKELGYRYDTSKSGKAEAWPTKDAEGIWEFPLARIYYNTSTSQLLSMDYNFYFRQTKAQDILKKGTPAWDRAFEETMKSFNRYFDTNYAGTRAPVQIGNHFSEWNDKLYWEAMKSFAERVCGLPDVKCVTMSEMMNELEH